MHALRYIVLSNFPLLLKKPKKFAPSLTGDINPPKFPLNNVKMTIAYNSAYIQTETLNFTFARQAVIVYSDAEC